MKNIFFMCSTGVHVERIWHGKMTLGNKLNLLFLSVILYITIQYVESRCGYWHIAGPRCGDVFKGDRCPHWYDKKCQDYHVCYTYVKYQSWTNTLVSFWSGCWNSTYCKTLGTDKCVLRPDVEGYSCCCTEYNCNINGIVISNDVPENKTMDDLARKLGRRQPYRFDKKTFLQVNTTLATTLSLTTNTTAITTTATTSTTTTTTTAISTSKLNNTSSHFQTSMSPNHSKPNGKSEKNLLIYILPVVFGFCILVLFAAWCIRRKRKPHSPYMDPILMGESKSLLSDIELQEVVSRGKFGCVRKALYKGQLATLKCFNEQASFAWDNEQRLYSKYSIQHENISEFIASKIQENQDLKYWIFTDQYAEGSLNDFLCSNLLDFEKLLNAATSIVNGLFYLHSENSSSQPVKPSIAHCDLKSKNILVKDATATCCISDLGLATVLHDNAENEIPNLEFVSPRYMAPELLQGMARRDQIAFLSLDVYSLSLIMWELISRCNAFDFVPDGYSPPYHEFVGSAPSVEDMRVCVIEKKNRPNIKPYWNEQPLFSKYCQLVQELWNEDIDSRPQANVTLQKLKSLIDEYREQYLHSLDRNNLNSSNHINSKGETKISDNNQHNSVRENHLPSELVV